MVRFGKLNEDGFLVMGSGKAIPSGYIARDNFPTDEDGKHYEYYLEVDGMYAPNVDKIKDNVLAAKKEAHYAEWKDKKSKDKEDTLHKKYKREMKAEIERL